MKNRIMQFVLLGIIALIVVKGAEAVEYAKSAMELCYHMIIPTLFPFFICSGLLIYSGFCDTISKLFAPVMPPFFNINPNGSAAFIIGIISGYPQGAVTVCQLYESRYISKTEAERLLAFCNNSGPLFILSAVGIGMYADIWVGVALYAVHIAAAILVGMIFKFYKKNDYRAPITEVSVNKSGAASAFGSVLDSSVKNILNVCGSVVFFSVIARLVLDITGVQGILRDMVYGVCEFSSGMTEISKLDISFFEKLIISSFILGFAGVSVHIQTLGFISKYELSMVPFVAGKILHGGISALLMWLFAFFVNIKKSSPVNMGGGFMMNSIFVIISVIMVGILGMILKNKDNTVPVHK